jgi:hypothetical protein
MVVDYNFLGVYDIWAYYGLNSYNHDVVCHNSQAAFNGKHYLDCFIYVNLCTCDAITDVYFIIS